MGFEEFLSAFIIEYHRKFGTAIDTVDILSELELFYTLGYSPIMVAEIVCSGLTYE